MEDNKEYDENLLNSMDDIYERENELNENLKTDNENKVIEENNVVEVKSCNITSVSSKYMDDLKLSVIKYKNMILLLLIYVILNIK
jgi:hypothetical protein